MNDVWDPKLSNTDAQIIALQKRLTKQIKQATIIQQLSVPSVPMVPIKSIEEIDKHVKEYEREELLRTLTTHGRDENVEHLMEEVYMVLKMLHGEEVGKKIFKYRENLLKQREADIEHRRKQFAERIAAGQKR